MNRRAKDDPSHDLNVPYPNWVHRHHKALRAHNRPTVGIDGEASMTRPEFAKEADINTIVARLLAGQPVPMSQARYGDVDYTTDLQAAYAMADSLVETYNGLPEEVRANLTKTEFVSRILEGDQLEMFTKPPAEEKPNPSETLGKEDTQS